ncbi:MAG: beta strand repeat-containing protein, partial [Bryobacteraceae bacterium]
TSGGTTFTIQNTGGTMGTGGNLTFTVGGNLDTQALAFYIQNYDGVSTGPAGNIATGGNMLVNVGGNLTADSIDALVNNRSGGSIDSGVMLSFLIGGALTTTGDAGFTISTRFDDLAPNGSMLGSTIGGDAMVLITANSVNIGGNLANDFFGIGNPSGTGISNSGSTLNGNAIYLWNILGDMTVQGDATLFVLNDANSSSPLGGTLHGTASVGVSAANLTAGSLLAMIDNRSGGVIDSDASINFNISGNLTSPGDVTFEILNDQRVGIGTGGGSIGKNATIGLSIAQDLTIGGDATFQILNDNNDFGGGTIVGDATITIEANTLSAASLTAQIVNTGGTIEGISTVASTVGGNLTANGTGGLSFTIANNSSGQIDMAADVLLATGGDLTASSLLAFINNRDGGSIGADASVLVSVGGALATTGDATVVISGRDDGGGAGSIVGNASVILTADSVNVGGALVTSISEAAGGHLESGLASVNVFGGDITTGGALTFSIQNGGLSQIGQVGGGTIDQDLQVLLNAANVTTGDFLLGLISNTDGGQIGGNAALALNLTGNLNAKGDGTLQIDNSTTMGALSSNIGSDATLGVAASNFTAATVLAQIINEGGGTIGGNATIGFAIAHGLTSLGDVTFEILNDNNDFGGGTIAGDATIAVDARTLSAASLLAQINNSGGSIGGASSILFAIGGALTTTGGADFHILGDSLTTPGATIAVTVGSFNIGGSLNASIGAGQTFFNFDNVTINATN